MHRGMPRHHRRPATHTRRVQQRLQVLPLVHGLHRNTGRIWTTLTLIPELGRPKRDVMFVQLQSVGELAACNPDGFINGKKTVFPGIGPDTLQKFHVRAKLLSTKDARPILHTPVALPGHDRELFFDIEVDPLRDICYLHGFVERNGRDNASERFVSFFAPECTPEAERAAFADAIGFLRAEPPVRDLLLFKIRADDLPQAAGEISRRVQRGRNRRPVRSRARHRPL